jgi:hypothetical protein
MKQTIVAELKRISGENEGVLMPEAVVESARPETSPLHAKFTWDDGKAAHEHRLWQARQLISVCVQYVQGDKQKQLPVFVSLKKDRKTTGGYRTLVDVMNSPSLHQLLLSDARAEMHHFRDRYKSLEELEGVRREMVKTEKELLTPTGRRIKKVKTAKRAIIVQPETETVTVKA